MVTRTGVPKYSAGGIGSFICPWYVSFTMHMHEYWKQRSNWILSLLLYYTSENIFI